MAEQNRTIVIAEMPIPHILTPARKTIIHGWHFPLSSGRRECSSERILLNPYSGCSVECPECYARAYGGAFSLWNKSGIITVKIDIAERLQRELSRLRWAACGYLSPVTDPFQTLESAYHLSEACIDTFLDLDLPVEIVTKRGESVPVRVLERMADHPYGHCFCQYTVLSLEREVQLFFAPGGSSPNSQLDAMRLSSELGLFTILRIDPILPGINDGAQAIEQLVQAAKERGCKHVIASFCDLNLRTKKQVFDSVGRYDESIRAYWRSLYDERQGSGIHAKLGYRLEKAELLRSICNKYGLTFALCMEFAFTEGKYEGLNSRFMTSSSCEGKQVPMYSRESLTEKFRPVKGCTGACLNCAKIKKPPPCGKPELAKCGALKYSDYLKL
uniref:Radical SAM protein n=1 Tax=Candidatus Methanomethylicus mesodigestus TaxID=1867258 RepID=A0A7C3J532_9CREN